MSGTEHLWQARSGVQKGTDWCPVCRMVRKPGGTEYAPRYLAPGAAVMTIEEPPCPPERDAADQEEQEVVGPLEQKVLEALCGKMNLGPWPPAPEAYAAASALIKKATGETPAVPAEDAPTWAPDDYVGFYAGLARRVDEGGAG